MNDFSKMPTVELLTSLTRLEKELDLKTIKYNLMIAEMYKRFPMLEDKEEFQPRALKKELKNK